MRELCHSEYTVGYIRPSAPGPCSILNHSILSSPPESGCEPAYTVPWTSRRSGPAVVVNLAESEFSGRRAFLIAVRFVAVSFAAFASSLLLLLGLVSSAGVAVGMAMWYSLII